MIDQELERIDGEISRLSAQREVLISLRTRMTGEVVEKPIRKRSANIKPLVLAYMSSVEHAGATTAQADEAIRLKVPTVAKDTVGSTLSRLKSDGALVYIGERYYEKRFAPQTGWGSPVCAIQV